MGSVGTAHGAVSIGVDIGQRVDPTALCVLERAGGREPGDRFQVRHVERLALGTKYPTVAARIAEVAGKLRKHDPALLLDATGVGMPVVDLVRSVLEAERIDCRVTACWFTHGDRLDWGGNEAKVGKAYLVSRLQALLQQRLLQWPRTAETEYLAQELLDYEIRVDENANDRYGAFKVGAHDDVVTAVGLAVIGADRGSGHVAYAAARTGDISLLEQLARRAEEARRAQEQAAERSAAADGGEVTSMDMQQEWERLERERQQAEHVQGLARMLSSLNGGRLPSF